MSSAGNSPASVIFPITSMNYNPDVISRNTRASVF